MNGSRKLLMFFGQILVAGILTAIGKMSGAEFVSLETMAIPVFIAGNFGEHFTKSKEVKPA